MTAVDNNMRVTRTAYECIGGYEALAATEDVQLFAQLVAQGWCYRHLIDPRVLGISVPQLTLRHLLHQRKCWMRGTSRLPWQLGALFGSYRTFYTRLAGAAAAGHPRATKVLCQSLFLGSTLQQAGHRERLSVVLLYEGYLLVMSETILVYTVWPGAIQWKRRYCWAEG